MEKILKPVSGYLTLVLAIVFFIGAILCFVAGAGHDPSPALIVSGICLVILVVFLFKGMMVVSPNHSRVCTIFGKYVGTVKANGLLWINPFYSNTQISLRS